MAWLDLALHVHRRSGIAGPAHTARPEFGLPGRGLPLTQSQLLSVGCTRVAPLQAQRELMLGAKRTVILPRNCAFTR